MKIALLAAVLVVAGCGGMEGDSAPTSTSELAASCDWCPGNAGYTTFTGSGATMGICPCPTPGSKTSIEFRIDPPLGRCAYIQCIYSQFVASGCGMTEPAGICGQP